MSELLRVAGQTLVIYVFLSVAMSTVGRQQMAQFTLVDYLIVALLGSAVETGLYHGGPSFGAGIVSALTLLVANRCLRMMADRVPRLRRLLVGTPVMIVHDGRILEANLRRARMTKADLLTALRKRGYDTVRDVRFAVAEANGSVGVVPASDASRGGSSS